MKYKKKHYWEKSYHAVEESFWISRKFLIEWKLCEDLQGLLGQESLVERLHLMHI